MNLNEVFRLFQAGFQAAATALAALAALQLSELLPPFQIASVALIAWAVYRVCLYSGELHNGRAKAFLVAGMGAIGAAVIYVLAMGELTVEARIVLHAGIWTWCLGVIRAFGEKNG